MCLHKTLDNTAPLATVEHVCDMVVLFNSAAERKRELSVDLSVDIQYDSYQDLGSGLFLGTVYEAI